MSCQSDCCQRDICGAGVEGEWGAQGGAPGSVGSRTVRNPGCREAETLWNPVLHGGKGTVDPGLHGGRSTVEPGLQGDRGTVGLISVP